MAKELLIRLTCDYCKDKTTVPGDRPLTPSEADEMARWLNVVRNDNTQEQFCSNSCAANRLKLMPSRIVTLDAVVDAKPEGVGA
jgi:hypothetical protein